MEAPKTNRWTRDQLLVALNVYHKLRFGQLDRQQKVIIDLAQKIGRTPDALAMKLGNLASLDPALKLRGIKGLTGASKLDRELWDEYNANPVDLVPMAQEKFDSLFIVDDHETTEVIPGKGIIRIKAPPNGDTETIRLTKHRRGQAYFRDIVLNNYDSKCAVTGLPVRQMLVASHILPWSKHATERLNIKNGISLNRLHDSAFDNYLISFDHELRLVLSLKLKSLLTEESVAYQFEAFEGKALNLPEDGVSPDLSFLSIHRDKLAQN